MENRIKNLFYVFMSTVFLMTVFEAVKSLFQVEEITNALIESHILTVIFSGLIAAFIASYVMKHYEKLNRQIVCSEHRFRELFSHSVDGIFLLKIENDIPVFVDINASACEMHGYEKEEVLRQPITLFDKEADEDLINERAAALNEHKKLYFTALHTKKDGTVFPVEASVVNIVIDDEAYFQCSVRDISELIESEKRLNDSLKEKDVLLKEVHHRVKNNLQIIVSLLSVQSMQADEPALQGVFRELQGRIKSMALVHEKLYSHGNFTSIDLQGYVERLVQDTGYSYDNDEVIVQRTVQSIELCLDILIPFGLILNELLTNSYKHAFEGAEGAEGTINIDIKAAEGDYFLLKYSDNGKGLPEGLVLDETSGMGMLLIQTFTKQLHGSVRFHSNGGAHFEFRLASKLRFAGRK